VLATKPPIGDEWIHEIKYDGYRLQVHRNAERVRIFTRHGYDWTDRFQVAFSAAHVRLIEVANNYCCAHSMAFRSRWDVRGQLRYCFRAASFADELADTFGGERIDFATTDRPADLV
jgi:hypothetical protein